MTIWPRDLRTLGLGFKSVLAMIPCGCGMRTAPSACGEDWNSWEDLCAGDAQGSLELPPGHPLGHIP